MKKNQVRSNIDGVLGEGQTSRQNGPASGILVLNKPTQVAWRIGAYVRKADGGVVYIRLYYYIAGDNQSRNYVGSCAIAGGGDQSGRLQCSLFTPEGGYT